MSPLDGSVVLLLLQIVASASASASSQRAGGILTRKLLRGYERVPPPGGPTDVEIGIFINYFYALNELTMDYSLSMYLRQRWFDPRLKFNPQDNNNATLLKLDNEVRKKIWVPDTYFRNEKKAITHDVTIANWFIRVDNNGFVWYVMKVTANLMCPMELHYYPLDVQGCPMRLESFDYDQSVTRLKWLDNKTAVQFDKSGRDLPHMDVSQYVLKNCSYNDTEAYPPGAYSCLEVRFIAKRDMSYYLMQFYIPSGLLVMLSWSSLWISADAVVARVNIGLTIVLALTSQTIEARKEMPRVPYIKAIDVWTATCLVFTFSSLIEFALVNTWSRRDARKTKKMSTAAVSTTSATSAPPTAGAAAATSGAPNTPTTSKATASSGSPSDGPATVKTVLTIEQPLKKDANGSLISLPAPVRQLSASLQRRLANAQKQRAHLLDRIARKLLPLSFLAFNIVYWTTYVLLRNISEKSIPDRP